MQLHIVKMYKSAKICLKAIYFKKSKRPSILYEEIHFIDISQFLNNELINMIKNIVINKNPSFNKANRFSSL